MQTLFIEVTWNMTPVSATSIPGATARYPRVVMKAAHESLNLARVIKRSEIFEPSIRNVELSFVIIFNVMVVSGALRAKFNFRYDIPE